MCLKLQGAAGPPRKRPSRGPGESPELVYLVETLKYQTDQGITDFEPYGFGPFRSTRRTFPKSMTLPTLEIV